MATRSFSFTPGEFYHVYNRGNDKRIIFDGEEDKVRFQKLLYLCNGTKSLDLRELPSGPAYEYNIGKPLTAIGAYALMDNHYHLLLKELEPGGISHFMLKLGTSHSMYFNLKYERTGRLFEGTFKGKHVTDDRHLKYLFAYIHLNPTDLLQRSPSKKSPELTLEELKKYPYSSYQDHLGSWRDAKQILSLEDFPQYFSNTKEYESEMLDWLTFSEG